MTEESQELFKRLHRIEQKIDNVLSAVIFVFGFYIFSWIFDAALAGYGNRWIAHAAAIGTAALVMYVMRGMFGLKKSN